MQLLWIGIGCRRGTSSATIETAIAQVLDQYKLSADQIAGVASVDRKSDEAGLIEFCEVYQFALSLFSVEALAAIAVPNPSIDRPSVAEAAALLASGADRLIVPKQVIEHRVTIAIA